MMELLSCLFFLSIAFNSYRLAKRQGKWSWTQFSIVVAVLIAVPVVLTRLLISIPWLHNKPGLFTLIMTSLIIASVCVLAYFMHKFSAKEKKTSR